MTGDPYRDASMLELFQMEAKAQGDILASGLLELERNPTAAEHLEACMRAAHSLKGAARIVDLQPAVPVAHTMEDCLVSAQEGRLRLTPLHIDALLQGTDILLRIAQPPSAGRGDPIDQRDIDAFVDRLQALIDVQGSPPMVSAQTAASAAFSEPAGGSSLGDAIADPVQDRAQQTDGARRTASATRESTEILPAAERSLRVTASTLNRLLGLSSEALVETQRLAAHSAAMLRLKRQHYGALRTLDDLHADLREAGLTDADLAKLAEARHQMAEIAQGLDQRMTDTEQFNWRITHLNQRLYDTALACRMRPLQDGITGMARMVRDLARELGKSARMVVVGENTRVDRDILEQLDAPLSHLLRNAVDHGIETPSVRRLAGKPEEGTITLTAQHNAGTLLIEVRDDGAGIDIQNLREEVVSRKLTAASTSADMSEAELLEFLFLPGFSTRANVTQISGRGVGLNAVQESLRQLRGSVRIHQERGLGTRFTLELPLSLSVVRSLLFEVGGELYALPLAHVVHALEIEDSTLHMLEGGQHFDFQERRVGLVSMRQLLDYPDAQQANPALCVMVLGEGETRHGLAVDRFVGERTLVIQPLDPRLGKVQDVAAASLTEGGLPVLILDAEDMLRSIEKLIATGRLERIAERGQASVMVKRKRILVVDDSLTVRELQRKLLSHRGYEVSVAVDGMDGWNMLRSESFDLVISDVDMPRMDGIELVTLAKSDARLAAIPIMIVSYKDREEDRHRGLGAGADYYLAKGSFHDETLLTAVEDLIGRAQS